MSSMLLCRQGVRKAQTWTRLSRHCKTSVETLAPFRITCFFYRNYIHTPSSLPTGALMSRSSSSLYSTRTLTSIIVTRELLLIEGISKAGLGNWQMIAEHIGARTREEVEEHYNSIYVDSPDWPLPVSLVIQCRRRIQHILEPFLK
jgi:hypothetical protein